MLLVIWAKDFGVQIFLEVYITLNNLRPADPNLSKYTLPRTEIIRYGKTWDKIHCVKYLIPPLET